MMYAKKIFIVVVNNEVYKLLKKRDIEHNIVSTITMQDNNQLSFILLM